MTTQLEIVEFSIVVVARNHNPTILNPDFLKDNEIVPGDWELAQKPICIDPMARVEFNSGVSITAQFDRVVFGGGVRSDMVRASRVPEITSKYVKTLPHVDYRAVGINFQGHVSYKGDENAPREFLIEKIIAPGPWREFGKPPRRASVKFRYELDRGECNLTVEDTKYKGEQAESVPVLSFSANFHNDLAGDNKKQRLENLCSIVENWETYLQLYQTLVKKHFLQEELE
jgi:hypothetical protein